MPIFSPPLLPLRGFRSLGGKRNLTFEELRCAQRKEMDDVLAAAFAEGRGFRIQLLAEHGWESVQRPVIIQELADERGRAAQALGLFLENCSLVRREAERLSEVVVAGGSFRHDSGSYADWRAPSDANLAERRRRSSKTSSVLDG